jgi:tetratricopeptide (TPR) repeat protein
MTDQPDNQEQPTFDQQGQTMEGDQYNAGRDIILADDATQVDGDLLENYFIKVEGNAVVLTREDASPQSRYQLRAPLPDFVGRSYERDRLIQALTETDDEGVFAPRTGIINGMAGIGKTELAFVVANRVRDAFPDGQIVLDMLGSSNRLLRPAQALLIVIRAFIPAHPYSEDIPTLQALYRSLLHDKRVLILLDNAANMSQIEPLTPPRGSALLITTRTDFRPAGSRTVRLDTLSRDQAMQLVIDICPRLVPEMAWRLADLCDGLPLALRLSASFLASDVTRDVDDYLQQLLHKRLDSLKVPGADPNDPQESVTASLNLSYDALDATDQRVLRSLSVFSTDFDVAAAEAILDSSITSGIERLGYLYRQSLVEYDTQQQRYDLHGLVREYVLEKLRQHGEEATLRLRHAQYYAQVASDISYLYDQGGEHMIEALRRFDQERPQIGAGWRWARELDTPTEERDELLLTYGFVTMSIGWLRYHPHDDRIPHYKAMLAAAQRRGRRNREGIAYTNLGYAYAALGDYRQAITQHEQNLAITREINNRKGEGIALGNLGLMYAELGDYHQAIELHRQNVEIAREVGNMKGEGIALGNLGYALTLSGEPVKALAHHTQQLAIARERGDRYGEAMALSHLGLAYLELRQVPEALSPLRKALVLARELGAWSIGGRVLDRLGQAYALQSDVRRAHGCFDQSIQIAREVGDQAGEVRTSWRKGELLVAEGQISEGLKLMQQRVGYEERIGHQDTNKHARHLAAIQEQIAPDASEQLDVSSHKRRQQ